MAVFHSLLPTAAVALSLPQPSSSVLNSLRISSDNSTGSETNTHAPGPLYCQGAASNAYLTPFINPAPGFVLLDGYNSIPFSISSFHPQ